MLTFNEKAKETAYHRRMIFWIYDAIYQSSNFDVMLNSCCHFSRSSDLFFVVKILEVETQIN